MKPDSASSQNRLLFADWLRAWALLAMIETHVFNIMLLVEARRTSWFNVLNFFNGLVAPSFLFISGFVFVIVSSRRLEQLRGWGQPFRKVLKRILVVWVIAYCLHLPGMSLRKVLAGYTAEEWLGFYRVDVLHCICFTWLFLLLTLMAIESEWLQRAWLGVSIGACVGLAPLISSIDFLPLLPAPLAAYLNDRHYSLFPLFPWSAFMLAGALCASLYQSASRKGTERRFMTILGGVSGLSIVLGYFLPVFSWLPAAGGARWGADPRTFLLRLGIVLALLCGCWAYGLGRAPKTSLLLDVSRESLFIYVGHLVFLYLPVWRGSSLAYRLARSSGPAVCALASLLLIVLMLAAAKGWSRLKQRPRRSRELASTAAG